MKNLYLVHKTNRLTCTWVATGDAKMPLACVWLGTQTAQTPSVAPHNDEIERLRQCA
jgi:hypothetical protein